MTVPYQYIVAGLPDIIFAEQKIDTRLHTLIKELKDQIPADDARLLSYVGYHIDNRNLLIKLLHKNDPILQFGNFSEEELEEEIKSPDLLPDYMQEYLAAYNDNTNIIQNMTWENQLYWLFFDHTSSLENRFLNEWFTFELNLRNILTAIKCRSSKIPFENHIICRNEVTALILKSNAPDFALPSKISWADDLFAIDFYSIAPSEEKLVRFRLQQLEDMAEPELFSIETIMQIAIALSLAERWDLLDTTAGKQRLEKIIDDLESSYKAE